MLYTTILFLLIGNSLATLSSLFHHPSILSWEGGSLSIPSSSCSKSQYNPQNMIATKAAMLFDTLLVLTPRFKGGNPCTLSTYDMKSKKKEPEFTPFPSLLEHEEGNCNAIQNAVDFYIDHFGILWVLDSGIVEDMVKPHKTCPPKVVGISMMTKRTIYNLDLSELTESCSRLQYIVADYDCSGKPYLYITDAPSGSILVYNVNKNRGYKVVLPKIVKGSNTKYDSLYMVITKHTSTDTVLYISYSNSPYIFSIRTNNLKNGKEHGKLTNVGMKSAPIVFLGTDGGKYIYFRYKNEPSVYAWDVSTPFHSESLNPVYTSEEYFLPTAVTYDQLKKTVKVLESNFEDYISNSCGAGAVQQLVNI